MKTLRISATECELRTFGIQSDKLAFSELVDLIGKELLRRNLNKSVELAEASGLTSLSMEEITAEVRAVRNSKSSS